MELLCRPTLQSEPALGAAFNCEDWQCPSRDSCARHFGRSREYAAMIAWWDDNDATPAFTPYRANFEAACKHYQRDKPREWLKGWCSNKWHPCPGCDAPECPNAQTVVHVDFVSRTKQ